MYGGTELCAGTEPFTCTPSKHAAMRHTLAAPRSRHAAHFAVSLCVNIASRNENPTCNSNAANRNSMALGQRIEKPGRQSQNGRVVPTSAGSREAVQWRAPLKCRSFWTSPRRPSANDLPCASSAMPASSGSWGLTVLADFLGEVALSAHRRADPGRHFRFPRKALLVRR